MRAKSVVASALRYCPPLLRAGSRLYHGLHREFAPLSADAPRAIDRALRRAVVENHNDVGDYYEFGLYKGYTLLSAFEACRRLRLNELRLYGFDSFRGLPETDGVDRIDRRFFAGQFTCSRRRVERHLTKRGLDWTRCELIEGFFEQSLTEALKASMPRRRATVVMLDCDLHSSTRTALQWLADMLHPGSVILFDDWTSYGRRDDLGQPLAFDQFLDANRQFTAEQIDTFEPHGRTFILRQA